VDVTDRGFDFGFAQETFRDALIQVAHAAGVISAEWPARVVGQPVAVR
jgi:hypothetical protein